ncbi:NAD-dependent epimerase/dehydratase family protein [Mucilaginibacter sp. RS28]|uniref:NAD-dependent epimerase/dehydratase family protein n=1 Tax=Mucilaginibacter straminoryzae TaxID=2932774 RepID=A0A9X1X666_9SPHI|nr:NAD-dependent epimerase/dehydratase family protein [Mucilaginibacter straminoryzae]MCJ8211872.1 NAD-dependent epimerase/dehydratase family protein [Mucilaginibacter straminoryzae]
MILVTGATGFVGAELVKQLAGQNLAVRCTKRASSVIPSSLAPYAHLIEWVEADITDLTAMEISLEGVTQVYHCAAWVSFREADKQQMIYTNVTGTANLVNICMETGARVVHVSSIAAIGQAKDDELITEKHFIEETPTENGYAISKLESEMEVWRGIAEGLDAVIVNPSIIIGASAGADGSGQIFDKVRQGLKFYTSGSCGLVDVADVTKCMIALMNSDITAERFIINAENWPYKDLLNYIAAQFGTPSPKTEAKPWMLSLAWRGAALISSITGKAPALDKIAAQSASVVQNYDNSKIRKAIGIEFKPIKETINEIVAAFKSDAMLSK